MSSALEDRWTPTQTLGLARELLNTCWKYSQDCPEDNLGRGRLGAYFLLYELGQLQQSSGAASSPVSARRRSHSSPSNAPTTSIYRHQKPLQQARDGAKKVIRQLPLAWSPRKSRYHYQASATLALLQSDWMGAHCLLCVTEHALGHSALSKQCLREIQQRLQSAVNQKCADPSVTSGTAGILQAIWWLRQELSSPRLFHSLVVKFAIRLLRQAKVSRGVLFWPAAAITSPANPGPPPSNMEMASAMQLGAARGLAGILFTLWGCSPMDWEAIEAELAQGWAATTSVEGSVVMGAQDCLRTTLDHFMDVIQPKHVLLSTLEWSQGAIGYVLLLLRAAQVHQHAPYLQQAVQYCETMWQQRNTWPAQVGLAHGSSAIAVCFLWLSKYVPKPLDVMWQRRAEFTLQWALREWQSSSHEEQEAAPLHGLYEGLGGLVSVLLQLHSFQNMPLYSVGYQILEVPLLIWEPTADVEEDLELAHREVPREPLRKSPTIAAPSTTSIMRVEEDKEEEQPQAKPEEESSEVAAAAARSRAGTRSHYHAQQADQDTMFWSLQTESHIGDAQGYKPALVETREESVVEGEGERAKPEQQQLGTSTSETFIPVTSPAAATMPNPNARVSTTKARSKNVLSKSPAVIATPQVAKSLVTKFDTVVENKLSKSQPTSTTPPSAQHPTITTRSSLSQRKPRPASLETSLTQKAVKRGSSGSHRTKPTKSTLAGKVRLTRAAQLKLDQASKSKASRPRRQAEADQAVATTSISEQEETRPTGALSKQTGDCQASQTSTSKPSAVGSDAKHIGPAQSAKGTPSSLNSGNKVPSAETSKSPPPDTAISKRLAQKREEARLKAEQQEQERQKKLAEKRAILKAKEDERILKARQVRERAEQANREKVQRQAKERAERLARLKAQEQASKEMAHRKAEGERARLERAKAIRHQLEEANRAKVEMQTQWKAEKLAKQKAREEAKRQADHEARLERQREAELQRQREQQLIDEKHARILAQRLEKLKAEEEAAAQQQEENDEPNEEKIHEASSIQRPASPIYVHVSAPTPERLNEKRDTGTQELDFLAEEKVTFARVKHPSSPIASIVPPEITNLVTVEDTPQEALLPVADSSAVEPSPEAITADEPKDESKNNQAPLSNLFSSFASRVAESFKSPGTAATAEPSSRIAIKSEGNAEASIFTEEVQVGDSSPEPPGTSTANESVADSIGVVLSLVDSESKAIATDDDQSDKVKAGPSPPNVETPGEDSPSGSPPPSSKVADFTAASSSLEESTRDAEAADEGLSRMVTSDILELPGEYPIPTSTPALSQVPGVEPIAASFQRDPSPPKMACAEQSLVGPEIDTPIQSSSETVHVSSTFEPSHDETDQVDSDALQPEYLPFDSSHVQIRDKSSDECPDSEFPPELDQGSSTLATGQDTSGAQIEVELDKVKAEDNTGGSPTGSFSGPDFTAIDALFSVADTELQDELATILGTPKSTIEKTEAGFTGDERSGTRQFSSDPDSLSNVDDSQSIGMSTIEQPEPQQASIALQNQDGGVDEVVFSKVLAISHSLEQLETQLVASLGSLGTPKSVIEKTEGGFTEDDNSGVRHLSSDPGSFLKADDSEPIDMSTTIENPEPEQASVSLKNQADGVSGVDFSEVLATECSLEQSEGPFSVEDNSGSELVDSTKQLSAKESPVTSVVTSAEASAATSNEGFRANIEIENIDASLVASPTTQESSTLDGTKESLSNEGPLVGGVKAETFEVDGARGMIRYSEEVILSNEISNQYAPGGEPSAKVDTTVNPVDTATHDDEDARSISRRSSDTSSAPDGFDAMYELFNEAENTLAATLADILQSSPKGDDAHQNDCLDRESSPLPKDGDSAPPITEQQGTAFGWSEDEELLDSIVDEDGLSVGAEDDGRDANAQAEVLSTTVPAATTGGSTTSDSLASAAKINQPGPMTKTDTAFSPKAPLGMLARRKVAATDDEKPPTTLQMNVEGNSNSWKSRLRNSKTS